MCISPKLLDIDSNRIGEPYICKRYMYKRDVSKLYHGYDTIKEYEPRHITGRFPTQLFTNNNSEKFKYVKNVY